jgi:hypothetical protein
MQIWFGSSQNIANIWVEAKRIHCHHGTAITGPVTRSYMLNQRALLLQQNAFANNVLLKYYSLPAYTVVRTLSDFVFSGIEPL